MTVLSEENSFNAKKKKIKVSVYLFGLRILTFDFKDNFHQTQELI